MCKVKKILGIAGWILLGAVVGGVVGYLMGSDDEELSVTPVVTVLVTPEAAATATLADRNGSGELVPKVVVKNYGIAISSGPGAVYDIVRNAPMGSEYRIVGRNPAGDWWKIVFVDNDGEEAHGWLYAPFEKAVNAGGVGVVEVPPPPTVEVLSITTPEPTLIPTSTSTPKMGNGSMRSPPE